MCFFFLFSFFRLQAGNSLTHTQLFFFTFFSHFRDELEARRNKIVRKIIIRTQGSLYAKGWQTWVHVALKMKKYDQIIRRVAAKMKFRAATQCLTAWRQYCSTEKKQRRIVTAALHRIKNRVIISAFVEWKTTIARVVRNRRVVAKNLLRRAKLHVAAHWKAWRSYFTVGVRTRTQLKRLWRLKRARYLKLYWNDWMAKVATRCTICQRESRPLYKKSPPKLKHVHDWTKRESGWKKSDTRTDIPDYLKSLPPIKGDPPKSLHKELMKRPSPEDVVSSRTVGQLKRIINRAGKLQTMTHQARLELETSNRVLDGFVTDLIQSDILTENTRKEIEETITGEQLVNELGNSPKALDRSRNKKLLTHDSPGKPKITQKKLNLNSSEPVVLSNPREFSKETQDNLKRRSPKKKKKKKTERITRESALDLM